MPLPKEDPRSLLSLKIQRLALLSVNLADAINQLGNISEPDTLTSAQKTALFDFLEKEVSSIDIACETLEKFDAGIRRIVR